VEKRVQGNVVDLLEDAECGYEGTTRHVLQPEEAKELICTRILGWRAVEGT